MAAEFENVADVSLITPSVGPMKQNTCELATGSVSAATQKRAAPVCWTPIRKRTSTDAPFASGVPSVIAPTDSVPLKPDPLGWLGGCSNVVPRTVVPDRRGTTMSLDVIGRRSATPEIEGNVVMSMMRNRNRVMFPPVLLVNFCRMSSVPNVEFCAGSHGGNGHRRRAEVAARAHVVGRHVVGLGRVEPSTPPGQSRRGKRVTRGSRGPAPPAAGPRRHWCRWCPRT